MAGKILFIVYDQLRADCIHGALAGSLNLKNFRRLMNQSVTFASHNTVTAPCGPARTSLLTGLYAMNHRSVRNGAPLSRHIPNVATEARKAGYEPLLFGYSDTSPDPEGRDPNDPDLKKYEGVMPGFAEMLRIRSHVTDDWLADLKAKGYTVPAEQADYYSLYSAGAATDAPYPEITGPALYSAEDSDTAYLTDQAIGALSVRESSDWFAHLCYIRPHPPLVAPAPYNAMFDPGTVPGPTGRNGVDNARASHPFLDAFFSGGPNVTDLYTGFDGRVEALDDEKTQALRAVYFGLIAECDTHLGRLLDYLEASGQIDDTLIVVTADHGEMLGDRHLWGKVCPFEGAHRVPLIIRDPRRRASAGAIVDRFTESIDVAPTILDWLGADAPPGFNGCSLLPFLDGTAPDAWRDHVFFEIDLADPLAPTRYQHHFGLKAADCNLAVLREDRYKLVHFNGGLPPMLFDLQEDPDEVADRAGDPAMQGEVLRLTRAMLDHRMRHAEHSRTRMQLTPGGAILGD